MLDEAEYEKLDNKRNLENMDNAHFCNKEENGVRNIMKKME